MSQRLVCVMVIAFAAWYSVDTDARCVPGGGLEAFGAAQAGPSTLVGSDEPVTLRGYQPTLV
jgi:hypothetical protein